MKRSLSLLFFGFFLLPFFNLIPSSAQSQADQVDIVFAQVCNETAPRDCPALTGTSDDAVPFPDELKTGDTFAVHLILENPQQEKIVTVRSWLKYDAALLEATELSDKNSDFALAAPDGNEIDAQNGQVKIGRGVSGGGKTDTKLFIATVTFKVISPQARNTNISFVNFQKDDLGETGAFTLDTGTFQPVNVLPTEPKALELKINGGGSGSSDSNQTNTDNQNNSSSDTTPPEDSSPNSLMRPEGLRIRTSEKSTDLVWKISDETDLKGYYFYYSETSGFYIRRSDVGKTNHKEFTDLPAGKKYFFAITAYDKNGRESDYSDEVFAVIGKSGSESHPFTFAADGKTPIVPNDTTNSMPSIDKPLDETGPSEAIAIALAFSAAAFFLLTKRSKLSLFSR